MKKILLSLFIFYGTIAFQSAHGQDVAINILSIPPSIGVGQTGNVLVSICNQSSTVTAPPNKLRPLISMPPDNVNITGVSNIDGTPITNYNIILSNTGAVSVLYTAALAPLSCTEFYVKMIGVKVSPLEPISATLGFQGPQTVGNSPANDNSTTAITITAALPVNLVSFQGKWIKDQGNELSWVTSWEKNNAYFEVQSSVDAKAFEGVGRVTGTGSTAVQQSYIYVDAHPVADLTYYRLKQVDQDGKFVYSKIVSVRRGIVDKSLVIYPNPATDQILLRLPDQTISETTLYDLHGKQVLRQTDGSNQIPLSSLKAGVYVIDVKTATNEVYRQRFVKH